MQDTFLLAVGGMPKQLLTLAPVDWVIIGIYFAVVLGIGFYLKQFADTGEDFFMAGRKITAWVAGLSFISANLSALETIGWSAQTYQYGLLAAHSYWFNAVPAIIFLAMVMMPFYYICRTHSVPGYLKLRFDGRSSTVAGGSFTFMTVMVSGATMMPASDPSTELMTKEKSTMRRTSMPTRPAARRLYEQARMALPLMVW